MFNTEVLDTALDLKLDLRSTLYRDTAIIESLLEKLKSIGYEASFVNDGFTLKLFSLFDNTEYNVTDNMKMVLLDVFQNNKNGLYFSLGEEKYNKLTNTNLIPFLYRVIKFDDKTYFVKL